VATLRSFQTQIERSPSAFSQMLLALDAQSTEQREIAIVGKLGEASTQEALTALWRRYAPHDVIAVNDTASHEAAEIEADIPLLRGKSEIDGKLTFYVCRDYTCLAPTTDLQEVLSAGDTD
jgi:hypothetical protein